MESVDLLAHRDLHTHEPQVMLCIPIILYLLTGICNTQIHE